MKHKISNTMFYINIIDDDDNNKPERSKVREEYRVFFLICFPRYLTNTCYGVNYEIHSVATLDLAPYSYHRNINMCYMLDIGISMVIYFYLLYIQWVS